MKVISCASFRNTGSSAVTDLISEYDSVHSLTRYEFRFVHDTDGIMDLEYNLIENHNRDNSNHAVKRFLRLSRFNAGKWFNKRYEPFFNGQYMKLTEEYIAELTDLKYHGHDFYDYYDRGLFFYYRKRLENKIIRKLTKKRRSVLENEWMYCAYPTEEKFLDCTRKYINSLFSEANTDKKPYLLVDQIVPSSNIKKSLRYFDDIYVIVVDRDPRDLFIMAQVFHDPIVPRNSVRDFCDWFLFTHTERGESSLDAPRVIKINFEDLIYNYTNTVKKIEEFTGLEAMNHTQKFSMLNPKRSVHNTQLWKRYGKKEDIEYIEKRLSDYLFPFENYSIDSVEGISVEDTSMFDR